MAEIIISSVTLGCTPAGTFTTNVSYRQTGGGSFIGVAAVTTNPDGTFVAPVIISGLTEGVCYQIRFTTSGLTYTMCVYTEEYCLPGGSTTTTTTTGYTYFLSNSYECTDCSTLVLADQLVALPNYYLPIQVAKFYKSDDFPGFLFQITSPAPQTPGIAIVINNDTSDDCDAGCADQTTTTTTTGAPTTTTTTTSPYNYYFASPYDCADCGVPSGDILLVRLPLSETVVLGKYYTPATPDDHVYQIVSTTPQTPAPAVLLTGLYYTLCTVACPA